jgi:hypothetical protein
MLDFIRYFSPIFWVKLEILLKDSLENLLIAIAFKRRITAQHNE